MKKYHANSATAQFNLRALQRMHQKNQSGYRFRDKDPIIGLLHAAWQESGMSLKELATESTMSAGSLGGWFTGDVRRPQHASIKFVARALKLDIALYNAATGETLVYDTPQALHPPKKVRTAKGKRAKAKARPAKRANGVDRTAHA